MAAESILFEMSLSAHFTLSEPQGEYHFKMQASEHQSTSDHCANEAVCYLTARFTFLSQDTDII